MHFIVEEGNIKKSRIWFGLERSKNENWYFRRSGIQMPHSGPERSQAWDKLQPNQDASCAIFDFSVLFDDMNGTVWDLSCIHPGADFALCEIPYI